jgi:hypothetical protein
VREVTTKQKSRRRVAKKSQSGGALDPFKLYSYEALAKITGLSARKIRREVEEYKRLKYVQINPERGRMVKGQHYLDWLAEREADAED